MKEQARLVVMASGAGSTFQAIAAASVSGQLPAQIVGLIVNRPGIGAVSVAENYNIPFAVVNPIDFASRSQWDQELTAQVTKWCPHLIALAGFTQLLGTHFLAQFKGQVVNTHPSLLPQYGGQGMYGMKVHQAVIAAGEKQSGITVHYVTENYDEGPIVAQQSVDVNKKDSAESLAERIKAVEKEFYISILRRLCVDRFAKPS